MAVLQTLEDSPRPSWGCARNERDLVIYRATAHHSVAVDGGLMPLKYRMAAISVVHTRLKCVILTAETNRLEAGSFNLMMDNKNITLR